MQLTRNSLPSLTWSGMSRSRAEKKLPERTGRYQAVGGTQVSFVSLQNFVQILYGNSLPPSLPSLRRDQRDGLGGQHGTQGREEALGEGREVPGLRQRGARVSFVPLQFLCRFYTATN